MSTTDDTSLNTLAAAIDEISTFSEVVAQLGRDATGADARTDWEAIETRLYAAAARVVPPVDHKLALALFAEEVSVGPATR
jgi:hypothetical protein